MIRLFSHTETDFTHNGIHVLDDIALGDTCILSNGINEVYSLEMEVSIYNNSKWKDIESEMILKVPTSKGEQLFRIKEVVKGFNTIKIYGKHIFFDLENNFILDTNIVKKDGRSAIAQILGTMTNNMVNSFHGTSDISILNNSRLVRKNVVTALIGDGENSFLNRWGGELELDNFNFSINERIGSDRGFQIRYGKNATGYEGNINTYNLCTRIVPVGFDGLMLDGTKWVDSPNIAKYPQIYTYEVKFEDIKVKENEDDEEGYNTIEEAREALREAAVNYFTSTQCDLPSFSAVVNFITLRNTQEFKNVKALETVALGDDVSIYLSNIDVNASSRVVREKWNFFTKKHVELEIGEIKPNVFKQLINIKDTIDNIVENLGGNTWQDIINKSLDEATKLMEEGLKGSHVITMKNQIVIGDAPDIKDMVNCIVFNKNGIGFSNDGYLPDRLVSAMTIDGKINASCITTGELNAALIKVGVITGKGGKLAISVEDDYIHMTHTDSNTSTKIDAEGFYIVDSNGETIASLASKESWTELKADKVFANNIENIYLGDANLYVNHSNSNIGNGTIDNPFNSFSALKEHLEASPIINKDLNIYVISTGDVSDNLDLRGLKGRGVLNFIIDKNLVLNGNGANSGIYFYDCQNYISINGGRTGYNTTDGALINKFKYGVFFNKCKYGVVESIAIDTSGTGSEQWGILFRNTNGRTHRVDFCDTACAIYADQGSNVRDNDSCGNGSIAFYSLNASSIIFGSPDDNGYRPNGSLRKVTGDIVDLGNRAVRNSFRVAPPIPPTSDKYQDFSFSDYGYWSELYNNWNSIGYKTIYQGDWGYGNNRGIFTLPNSSINSFLANATVLDGSTITLQRENAGGYSSAQTIYLCGTTHTSASGSAPPVTKSYGSIGSLAWGEKKTFNLPKAFVQDLKAGTIKSVMFYTSNGSNYIKFSAVCTLRLKVNK